MKFTAENPNTQLYSRLYEQVKGHLPDPVNHVFAFYLKTQQIPSINIKLDPPPVLRSFYAKYHAVVAPVMEQARLIQYTDAAAQIALKKGKRLAAVAVEQAKYAAVRLSAQATKMAVTTVLVPVQLTAKAAQSAISAAPKYAEAALPSIDANGRVRIPIFPGLPGPAVSASPPNVSPPNVNSLNPLNQLPAVSGHGANVPVFPLPPFIPGVPVPHIHFGW